MAVSKVATLPISNPSFGITLCETNSPIPADHRPVGSHTKLLRDQPLGARRYQAVNSCIMVSFVYIPANQEAHCASDKDVGYPVVLPAYA
jgi:hypothetical protein